MRRFITGMPRGRFTPAQGPVTLSGALIETDDATGRATADPSAARRGAFWPRRAVTGPACGRLLPFAVLAVCGAGWGI
jgi:hypothetical protein